METTQTPQTKALFSTVEGTLDSTKERVMVTFNKSAMITLNYTTIEILLAGIQSTVTAKHAEFRKRREEGYNTPKDVAFKEFVFVAKLAELLHLDMKALKEDVEQSVELHFERSEVVQFRKLVLADFELLEIAKKDNEAHLRILKNSMEGDDVELAQAHTKAYHELVDKVNSEYGKYISLKELVLSLNLWLCGEIQE